MSITRAIKARVGLRSRVAGLEEGLIYYRDDAERQRIARDQALSDFLALKEATRHTGERIMALCRLANDLRLAGDVELVRMDEEGVAPANISLADELWLIAFAIDSETAMAEAVRINGNKS